MLLSLCGFDVPLTALCWGVACAALLQITMMTAGPLLLLTSTVWACTIFSRVFKSISSPTEVWYPDFYRGRMAPLLLLAGCVMLAAVWMLFFYVGQYLIFYVLFPVVMLLLAISPLLRSVPLVRLLCKAVAYAFACAAPAFFFSFTIDPLTMLLCKPVWYMGCLFFLFAMERARWRKENRPPHPPLVVTLGLGLLLLCCIYSSMTAPFFERSLCIAVAIGAGCLQALARLSSRWSREVLFALGWPAMTLPALLGILVYAPEAW